MFKTGSYFYFLLLRYHSYNPYKCDDYDLLVQLMTDVVGNPEEERRAEFYNQPWSQEAVSRYFYCKVSENDTKTMYN